MNASPIPSVLSGCSVGNSGNGIESGSCLQKAIRQRYSPKQYRAFETWYFRAITLLTKLELIGKDSLLTFKTEWSRFSFWVQIRPQGVPRSRSQVHRGKGQVLCHKAGPQVPLGLGPCPIQGVGVMVRTTRPTELGALPRTAWGLTLYKGSGRSTSPGPRAQWA